MLPEYQILSRPSCNRTSPSLLTFIQIIQSKLFNASHRMVTTFQRQFSQVYKKSKISFLFFRFYAFVFF